MKLAALISLVLACASAASASPGLRGGITDSGAAYYGQPADFYPRLEELGVQVLRVHLNWGGRLGVAKRKPREGTDADDKRVRLAPLRPDRPPGGAARRRGAVHDLRDASVGERRPGRRRGRRAAPSRCGSSPTRRRRATAAPTSRADGVVLPRVRYWTAWNEPNLRIGLVPQWRRVGGKWIVQSAIDYARICNAVVEGIRTSMLRGQKVACGVTAARGNNNPKGAEALRLAARVPARDEEGGRDRLRRLRTSPVLRRPGGGARRRRHPAVAASRSATSTRSSPS